MCKSSITRCLSFVQFCVMFSTSLFLAMVSCCAFSAPALGLPRREIHCWRYGTLQAPWALAMTEGAVMAVVYVLLVHPKGVKDFHYDWQRTEQDLVLFSWARSLAAVVSFFLGLGRRLHA